MDLAIFALIMTVTGPQGDDNFTLDYDLTMVDCHEEYLEAANNTINENISFVCKLTGDK